MSEFRTEIREYKEKQPNGDRATTTVPSSRFEVWVVPRDTPGTDMKKGMRLAEYDQFDTFNVHVSPREPLLKEVKKYAADFNKIIGGTKVIHRTFEAKPVHRTDWEEVETASA